MPSNTLDDRKGTILRAVVQEYIRTAQPVGSAHVTKAGHLDVSAATVRNEMALLEREGYLAQPHTSAGRIPTDKGYRFFVDTLAGSPGRLAPVEKKQVQAFFNQAHGEIESMLHDTSRLLSRLTHYAAVVVAPPQEATIVRSVQLVALGPGVALAIIVLSTGVVQKATIVLDVDTAEHEISAASVHLASHLIGRQLADSITMPPTGNEATDRVVARAWEALTRSHEAAGDHVFVGGAAEMAATFDAVGTVRQVLDILEQQYVLVTLLREALQADRLNVSIGAEHGVDSLAECSIVVAPYELDGMAVGTVGVLGPTRMNYPLAMAAVAVVSQRLGRHLSEG